MRLRRRDIERPGSSVNFCHGYASILLVSFFVQRPGVRRLLGLRDAATEAEKERWRVRARRQRYISYVMAGAIRAIGWLMMSKPTF